MIYSISSPTPLTLPEVDPMLHGMVIVAFLIHALFMNLILGGTLVTVMTDAVGVVTARSHFLHLASTLAQWLPGFLGLAVILGVFPLVLVQILYGPLFVPTANLLGEWWMVAVVAGILGYAGLYGYKHGRETLKDRPGFQLALGAMSGLMFLVVAFIFVLASVLILNPDSWARMNQTSPWALLSLPSLIPRYGHLVLAAVAGMGMFLVGYGLLLSWKRQARIPEEPKDPYATWVIQYGVAWTLAGTLPQIVVGPWLLLSLPDSVRADLVSGANVGSLAFFMALTAGLISVVLLNAALMVPQARGLAIGGTVSLLVTVCFMVVVRHAVRVSWLSQHDQNALFSNPEQWNVLIMMGMMLLLGLGLMGFMVRAYKKRHAYQ